MFFDDIIFWRINSWSRLVEKFFKLISNLINFTMKVVLGLWGRGENTATFKRTKNQFSKKIVSFVEGINWIKIKFTFVFEVKFPVSEHHSSNGDFSENEFNNSSIIVFDVMGKIAVASPSIEMERNTRLDAAIHFVTPSNHVISRNRRMVTDLFHVQWTTVNVALISLSEYGVEGFLRLDSKDPHCDHNDDWVFHSFKRVLDFSRLLKVDRTVTHRLSQGLQMRSISL